MKTIFKTSFLSLSILSLTISCSLSSKSNIEIINPLFNKSINDKEEIIKVFDKSNFNNDLTIEQIINDYHQYIENNNKDLVFNNEEDYEKFYLKNINKFKSHYSYFSNKDEALRDTNYFIERYYELNNDQTNNENSYFLSEMFTYEEDLTNNPYKYRGIYQSLYIYFDEETNSYISQYNNRELTGKNEYKDINFLFNTSEISISSYEDIAYYTGTMSYNTYFFSHYAPIHNFISLLEINTNRDYYQIKYSPRDKLYLINSHDNDQEVLVLIDNNFNTIGTYGTRSYENAHTQNGENVIFTAFNVNKYEFEDKKDTNFNTSLTFDINDEQTKEKFLSILLEGIVNFNSNND